MEQLYTDNFLLDRLYSHIEKKQKLVLIEPKIEKNTKLKRTFVNDFIKFCDSLKRDYNTVKLFIENELSVETSINSSGVLIVSKTYDATQIMSILNKYIKIYVVCTEAKCNSANTIIIKENRITYMYCNTCHSKKSIK